MISSKDRTIPATTSARLPCNWMTTSAIRFIPKQHLVILLFIPSVLHSKRESVDPVRQEESHQIQCLMYMCSCV